MIAVNKADILFGNEWMTADVRDQLEGDASDGKLAVEFIDIWVQALVGWVSLSQGNGVQIFLV